MQTLTLISRHKMFNGYQSRYSHFSESTQCEMLFSIFLPSQSAHENVSALYWLSGLTCNDQNFSTKSGAQYFAEQFNIALIIPDTSPRGNQIADAESYDLGQGAGFYVNAIQSPWAENYKMYDYIVHELPQIIEQHFPITTKRSIAGHSMGGHGALMIGLKNSDRYQSISAFAPIVNPSQTPLGKKVFSAYLGNNNDNLWKQYDSVELLSYAKRKLAIMIDQGNVDEFYPTELQPEKFIEKAKRLNFPIDYQLQEGYDHSYYFVASFIKKHIEFHAKYLM